MKIEKEFIERKEIDVCSHDTDRCSRNCEFCHKEDGLYHCFLRSIRGEDIEGREKEDIDVSDEVPSSESYGFTRTDYCKKTFTAVADKSERSGG